MIYQLFYFSDSNIEITEHSLEQILKQAHKNNDLSEITGALIFDGKMFFQILEGSKDKVLETFERIKNDSRHSVLIDIRETKENRDFSGWSMAYKAVPDGHSIKSWFNIDSVRRLVKNPNSNAAAEVIGLFDAA